MTKYPIRYDHRGREVPVGIPIDQIDYIWIRDRGKNKEELDWLWVFEKLLRNGDDLPLSSKAQQESWESVKALYRAMIHEMKMKGSTNIIDGMRDPFLVRWWQKEEKWVPLKGNQRLCVLRAEGHEGDVPCRIRLKQ